LVEFAGGIPSTNLLQLGRNVAELVRDGDTLQFGIGKIQSAILNALSAHRRLRVWSGMVSTDVLNLLDSGVIAGDAAIETGVALGDTPFYERIGRERSFFFRPVSETHDVRRIAAIPNFVAINAALEVDLFGQVNSEALDGRLVAGVGGMPAFAQGALLSPGGRSLICLAATAAQGQVSRIVPRLGPGSLVALPRHAADTVVTEYGVACLEGLGADARAERLIELAAPQFRAELAAQWRDIRARL
jgi:acyl-CoA hydrolase